MALKLGTKDPSNPRHSTVQVCDSHFLVWFKLMSERLLEELRVWQGPIWLIFLLILISVCTVSKISSESHDIICHQGPVCGHLSDVHTDWCFLAMSSFSPLTCLFSCLDEIIVMRSVVLNDCRCHMRWDEVVLLTVCQINYDVFMYKWMQFAWFVFSHSFIHEPHRWTWRQSVTGVVGVCNAI